MTYFMLILLLFGLVALVSRLILSSQRSNDLHSAVYKTAYICAFATLPMGMLIENKMKMRALNKIAINWCRDHNVELDRIDSYKRHYAIVYTQSGKKQRKKFWADFSSITWTISYFSWVDK